jgi:hypothetical protein
MTSEDKSCIEKPELKEEEHENKRVMVTVSDFAECMVTAR